MESDILIQKLYIKLLKFIALKPRTEGETAERLSTYLYKFKDMPSSEKEAIKKVLMEQLREENLINDATYVRDYIDSMLLSSKHKDPNSIRQFLMKKQLPREAIAEILNKADGDYQKEALKDLVQKKIRTYAKFPPAKAQQKLIAYLLSKGFSYDLVRTVIDEDIGVE